MRVKSKEQINKVISFEIKSIQKQILDVCELVVPNSNWEPFRKKVLDITNDSRRKIQSGIDSVYKEDRESIAVYEDIIEVSSNKVKVI